MEIIYDRIFRGVSTTTTDGDVVEVSKGKDWVLMEGAQSICSLLLLGVDIERFFRSFLDVFVNTILTGFSLLST